MDSSPGSNPGLPFPLGFRRLLRRDSQWPTADWWMDWGNKEDCVILTNLKAFRFVGSNLYDYRVAVVTRKVSGGPTFVF